MADRTTTLVPIAQVLGLSSASFLTSYIASFTLSTVPSLLAAPKISPTQLAQQWSRAFHLGKATAPPFALVTSGCFAFLAWHYRHSRSNQPVSKSVLYGLAAALTPCIVPFTQVVMWPGIVAIESVARAQGGMSAEAEVGGLVARWSRQNVWRAVITGSAAVLSAVAMVVEG